MEFNNCRLSLTSNAVRIYTPDPVTALQFDNPQLLALWALKFGKHQTEVWFPGCIRPMSFPVGFLDPEVTMTTDNSTINIPNLVLGTCEISPELWRVLGEALDHPEWNFGLVERATQRQIVTSASNAPIVVGTLQESVTWKRQDYWHPADLENYMRDSQQQLEPNNPQSVLSVTYRTHENWQDWLEQVTQYRLVEDRFGRIYEVALVQDYRTISTPTDIAIP